MNTNNWSKFAAEADNGDIIMDFNNSLDVITDNRSQVTVASRRLRGFIRSINFQLLQYCRPEHVFLSREKLPAAYINEYFKQEHFVAANLIRSLAD